MKINQMMKINLGRNFQAMSTIICKTVVIFLISTSCFLLGAEEKNADDSPIEYEICSPVSIQPNSAIAKLQSKIMGETDIELAILVNAESSFDAVILWNNNNVYNCDFRTINYKDIYSDDGLDKNLISTCAVDIKSFPIDKKMADILKETLKNQAERATYKVDVDFKWTNYLDGSVYSVYAKGNKDDVFPIYAARFFNPKFEGSYRCDAIYLALKILATNENENLRKIPTAVPRDGLV